MSKKSEAVLDVLEKEGKSVEESYLNYDQEELALGILVELEHADDVRIAEEIAKDHLEEDPNYYSDPENPFLEEIDDEYIAASLQPVFSALSDVKEKEYPDMDQELFEKILTNDPTYKEGSNKIGKYGRWLLKKYKTDSSVEGTPQMKKHLEIGSWDVMLEFLEIWTALANKKMLPAGKEDINKLSLREFNGIIKDYVGVYRELDRDMKKFKEYLYQQKHPERAVPVVYKDNEVIVSAPGSFQACHKFGEGGWCTTANSDFYDKYTYNGEFPLLWIQFASDSDKESTSGKAYRWQVSTSPYGDGAYVHSFETESSKGEGWSQGIRIQHILDQMSEKARMAVADYLEENGANDAAEGFASGFLDADEYNDNPEYGGEGEWSFDINFDDAYYSGPESLGRGLTAAVYGWPNDGDTVYLGDAEAPDYLRLDPMSEYPEDQFQQWWDNEVERPVFSNDLIQEFYQEAWDDLGTQLEVAVDDGNRVLPLDIYEKFKDDPDTVEKGRLHLNPRAEHSNWAGFSSEGHVWNPYFNFKSRVETGRIGEILKKHPTIADEVLQYLAEIPEHSFPAWDDYVEETGDNPGTVVSYFTGVDMYFDSDESVFSEWTLHWKESVQRRRDAEKQQPEFTFSSRILRSRRDK